MFSKGQASANRVADVLDLPPDLEVLPAEKCEETGNHIEFRDVSFSYTGKGDHLEHVSFALKHGGCLSILGPTGAGKSTLVNLLLRLYDRREGEILLDGRDVRTIPTEELRQKFRRGYSRMISSCGGPSGRTSPSSGDCRRRT